MVNNLSRGHPVQVGPASPRVGSGDFGFCLNQQEQPDSTCFWKPPVLGVPVLGMLGQAVRAPGRPRARNTRCLSGRPLAAITVGKKEVATAVGWLLCFIKRKATEAGLTAEVKVNLSAGFVSWESEACECEQMHVILSVTLICLN